MNSERLKECIMLSEEILKNIELSELPMKSIVLKCLRQRIPDTLRMMNVVEAHGNTGDVRRKTWSYLN